MYGGMRGSGRMFRLIMRHAGVAREMGGEELSLAVQRVDQMFIHALEKGASDIHMHPEHNALRIRFRIDGVLHEHEVITQPDLIQAMISRVKLAANMHLDEKRDTQDGRIDMEYLDRRLSARVSCIPTLNGERIVMRILDPAKMQVKLDSLGMPQDVMANWRRALQVAYGMLVVTGPTGSGKTSTLYASLHTLDRVRRNIVTVEDPVEYEFPDNVMQVQVTEKITFPRALRAMLRHDPDVIMIGEIRDRESLQIGIQAALTGHLVLSTLHTNNAIETLSRMMDMGAEDYLIAATLQCAMAQRLVRVICPDCRVPYQPTPDEIAALKIPQEWLAQARFYTGKGCPKCMETGYRGRTGIFELLRISPAIREAIVNHASSDQIMQIAVKEGFRTMLDDGRDKVLRGITTPHEVIQAVYAGVYES
ncbi:MAG: type II secretion system protein GspE [Armatimonadetes bacterium JP3_11]|nr:MAG: type II secretion system protein GspE [Armatimonadetes bacterium CP1_7O]OYT75648.1 MAG: type II secretion system protein GspE [Armatimonadetes bacterium JP3_11]RMH08578.1 MAG: type II/IV secretion system protein [Armatimonadota bacterium]